MWLLSLALAAEVSPDLTRRVDVKLEDADIHVALRFLADVGGFSLVVADGVGGKVTLSVKDVAVQDALQVILLNKGLSYTVTGRVLMVQ